MVPSEEGTGRLVIVPACGHNVHSGNTPGFLEAVDPFVDALDRS